MKLIELAAYLHDIGKLAIPNEIIEKPGKLNDDEMNAIRESAQRDAVSSYGRFQDSLRA